MQPPVPSLMPPDAARSAKLARLRQLLPRLEGMADAAAPPPLPLAVAAVDAALPNGGLARHALHEVAPVSYADLPAAGGFFAALLARILAADGGLAVLVTAARGFADCGRLYGHGLAGLGLDPARLLLVQTETDADALWAIEEALQSRAAAVVAGCLGAGLDLTASRRLHLAAGGAGVPAVLLRPHDAGAASAAATRWRISAAPARRDRFGLLARPRWQVALTRCRNGRPGAWVLEFDHAAHRFGLVPALADHTLSEGAGPIGAGAVGAGQAHVASAA